MLFLLRRRFFVLRSFCLGGAGLHDLGRRFGGSLLVRPLGWLGFARLRDRCTLGGPCGGNNDENLRTTTGPWVKQCKSRVSSYKHRNQRAERQRPSPSTRSALVPRVVCQQPTYLYVRTHLQLQRRCHASRYHEVRPTLRAWWSPVSATRGDALQRASQICHTW